MHRVAVMPRPLPRALWGLTVGAIGRMCVLRCMARGAVLVHRRSEVDGLQRRRWHLRAVRPGQDRGRSGSARSGARPSALPAHGTENLVQLVRFAPHSAGLAETPLPLELLNLAPALLPLNFLIIERPTSLPLVVRLFPALLPRKRNPPVLLRQLALELLQVVHLSPVEHLGRVALDASDERVRSTNCGDPDSSLVAERIRRLSGCCVQFGRQVEQRVDEAKVEVGELGLKGGEGLERDDAGEVEERDRQGVRVGVRTEVVGFRGIERLGSRRKGVAGRI